MAMVHYYLSPFCEYISEAMTDIDEYRNSALSDDRGYATLRKKIDELEKKEHLMLDALNIPGGELSERLKIANKRITDYNNMVEFTLSGQELFNRFILPYQTKGEINFKQLNENFRKAVIEEIQKDAKLLERIAVLKGSELYPIIMKLFNKDTNRGGDFRYMVSSGKGIKSISSLKELDIRNLTPAQQRRAEKIAEDFIERDPKLNPEVNINITSSSIDQSVDWYGHTKGKKGTDVANKKGEITRSRFKNAPQRLLNDILKILPTGNLYRERFTAAYNHVISKRESAIFVGQNAKDITGLLGEIQSMIYLDVLLNGANHTNMNNIFWYGGTIDTNSKNKPHADILLTNIMNNKGFGVQSKNTTLTSGLHSVDFTSLNAANFLNSLEKYGISSNTKIYLENAFAAYNFNIGTIRDKSGKYIETDPGNVPNAEDGSNFKQAREELDNLPDIALEIFELFAAELMYMSTTDFLNSNPDSANVLYIIGSSGIQLASQILAEKDEIIKKTEEGQEIKRFNIDIDFNKKGPYTIVDAYNNNKSALTIKNSKDQSKSMHSYEYSLSNIQLKSSYVFSF